MFSGARPCPALTIVLASLALAMSACRGDAPSGAPSVDADANAAGDANAADADADPETAPDAGSEADASDAGPTDSGATGDADAPDADAAVFTNPFEDAGGAAYRGDVLLHETFDDGAFSSRGWYDSPRGTISTVEHLPGSPASFECRFAAAGTKCAEGTPGRFRFPPTAAVYLSYWVRYSPNYVGSGRPYHPHEFHFLTDADGAFIGPSATHLTAYVEQVGGVPRLALQDASNVDPRCVLRNDGSFVGCNGDFSTYAFGEARSACACNGLIGDVDARDCYSTGADAWYSSRAWRSSVKAFDATPGPRYRADWHYVEAYFRMNSISAGIGVADGAIRLWVDGALLITSDHVLMRTGAHPTLAFNQFLVAPYIGDGSPVDQSMFVDELTVAAGR